MCNKAVVIFCTYIYIYIYTHTHTHTFRLDFSDFSTNIFRETIYTSLSTRFATFLSIIPFFPYRKFVPSYFPLVQILFRIKMG